VHVDRCDVSDLEDVRRFASDLDLDRLDVLIHNAGAMPPKRTVSPQGHELTMALHVLGPVLMTQLLQPVLARHDARVILVTSGGMYGQALRADDPEYRRGEYSPTTAYARSKRAQVELLPVLARRWSGPGIGVHATHPGWADTPGVQDSLPRFHQLTGPLLRDAESGAHTTVWLAASGPQPRSGRLWHDRRPRPTHLLRRTRTGDDERATMWEWVREQTGIGA
jgi:NAD(P)-dependent dehydrogenase (short-subunit alcohol dehydrogenase family)